VEEARLSVGAGTITGRPLLGQMLRVVGDVYHRVDPAKAIKASGGVSTAHDAFAAIAAGASSVEMVTAFIYEGWNVARHINRGLIELMEQHRVADIGHLRGLKTSAV